MGKIWDSSLKISGGSALDKVNHCKTRIFIDIRGVLLINIQLEKQGETKIQDSRFQIPDGETHLDRIV